jgi:outer membrane protein assembly factor BamB
VPANDALPRGPITLTRSWARPLGVGYAGIATSGALVVTMYGDGREDHVVALDAASGETRWRRAIGPMFPAGGGSEGGPKSTPTIDGDTVYALGPNGDLLALALADGAERWRIQLVSDVGAVRPEFGFATSPLVIGERLVVATGGPSGHGITALDKASGAALWSAGDDPLEYPSPIPATLAGVEQVVAVSDGAALGLDPATGAVLWRFPHELHEVPTAVLLGDDRVLVPGVEETLALRVRRSESGLVAEKLWASLGFKGSTASPVLHEGLLYGFNGEFLTAVSPDDGHTVWKSRPPGGAGLIGIGERLAILARGGALVIAAASPTGYREEARVEALERSSFTYPAYAGGRLFVRDTQGIAAVTVGAAGEGEVTAQPRPRAGFLTRLRESVRRWLYGSKAQ